jgi:choline monooxygenase
MSRRLGEIIDAYDPDAPLERASTIPAEWYASADVLELEQRTVFAHSWHLVGRVDQVRTPGQYVSCTLPTGAPVVVVHGSDGTLRAFFNVCRHHAAAVVTECEGTAHNLRCPYHGWTYALDGSLTGTPDFAGVQDFDRAANGLIPLAVAVWEHWVFVSPSPVSPSPVSPFPVLDDLHWFERRSYTLNCNWKVFVDNYLDGGYHVPHLHKGLNSVLDYSHYTIELGPRSCLQTSPIDSGGGDARTSAVRRGDRAYYYWLYPNFMINIYGGAMDTNLVVPNGVDRTDVVFDFFFSDVSDAARAHNLASIEVSEQIQEEDVAICTSVQRGLRSGAYTAGRLSVRREAGEHLFHRLLYEDLKGGL